MNWIKLALLCLSIAKKIVVALEERQLLDAGARRQVADELATWLLDLSTADAARSRVRAGRVPDGPDPFDRDLPRNGG